MMGKRRALGSPRGLGDAVTIAMANGSAKRLAGHRCDNCSATLLAAYDIRGRTVVCTGRFGIKDGDTWHKVRFAWLAEDVPAEVTVGCRCSRPRVYSLEQLRALAVDEVSA